MTTTKKSTRTYPRPVYAAAGVGELAVEQIKKLPETATKLRNRVEVELKKIDVAELREKVQSEAKELPGKVQSEAKELRGKVGTEAKQLRGKVQTEVKNLRGKVQTEVEQLRGKIADVRKKGVSEVRTDADKFRANAQDAVSDLVETAQKQFKAATKQATEVYDGLATRGEKLFGNGTPAKPATTEPKAVKAKATKATKTTAKAAK
ncbi:MAG: hypothetical protein ACRDT4_26515 [Micromonosporaceae bacterium]